jgi:hypothetical protein
MTTEEEVRYLRGQIAALTNICASLLATHVISDNLTAMVKSRAAAIERQAVESASGQTFAKGYASVLPDIEDARAVVRDAGLLVHIPEQKGH